MTTNEKGNIGLSKIIMNAVENGYQPFLPFTDTSVIDLVLANKELISKNIQVKYIKQNKNGSLLIPLQSVVNGKRVTNNFTNIDAFAIYTPEIDKVFYVPLNKFKKDKKSLTIKITETKRSKNSLMAKDFELIGDIFK
jgi:hypothetical protein